MINPDMHIISWNGVEAEFDFNISITQISVSKGMDIDGDGNSEHILCFPSYPGPISGMAGAGIEDIVLYKYTDGNLEVVGYEY